MVNQVHFLTAILVICCQKLVIRPLSFQPINDFVEIIAPIRSQDFVSQRCVGKSINNADDSIANDILISNLDLVVCLWPGCNSDCGFIFVD